MGSFEQESHSEAPCLFGSTSFDMQYGGSRQPLPMLIIVTGGADFSAFTC